MTQSPEYTACADKGEYVVTEGSLAVAFTEWDRRYREEPERFQREAERLLRGAGVTNS